MRYLITGSNGFIGKNLVFKLQQLNADIVYGNRDGSLNVEVDYIVDLASYGNLYSQKDEDQIYYANVTRLSKLLKNAESMPYKGFIVTSSSSVSLPKLTAYAKAKSVAEELALDWAVTYNKPVIVIRPYTVYGYGDNPEHFVMKVFDSCINGTPLTIDPDPTHDFVYVEDVVENILKLLRYSDHYKGKVINLGTGIATSNKQLINTIETVVGNRANIVGQKKFREYDVIDWKSPDSWGRTDLWTGLNLMYDNIKQGTKKKNT